jgi:hemerythrin
LKRIDWDESFVLGLRETDGFVSVQAMIFLEKWIKEHILKMDADYASFVLRRDGGA